MIDRNGPLPVARQPEMLNVKRSSIYYLPKSITEAGQQLMMRLGRPHLEFPFAGALMLRGLLRQEGFTIGRKWWVGRLMKRMAIEALYRKPKTT
jgi:putative transposase